MTHPSSSTPPTLAQVLREVAECFVFQGMYGFSAGATHKKLEERAAALEAPARDAVRADSQRIVENFERLIKPTEPPPPAWSATAWLRENYGVNPGYQEWRFGLEDVCEKLTAAYTAGQRAALGMPEEYVKLKELATALVDATDENTTLYLDDRAADAFDALHRHLTQTREG
jgi:hypothetical protein